MSKRILLSLLFLFSFSAYAEYNSPHKGFNICLNYLNNTHSDYDFNQCANAAFDLFDKEIKATREKSNFKNNEKWIHINEVLNTQLSSCEANARKTQSNTTLLRDLNMCKFTFYSNMLNEAQN